MKPTIKHLASALFILVASATVNARPIVLPDPATSTSETGTFTISAKNEITLNGSHVSLTTSLPSSGDIATGSARFMSGDLQYHDGNTTVDGKMAKVTFGSQTKTGQVTYLLKGLIYGTLNQDGKTIDVNGNFAVSTKPAPEGTELSQAQVDSSHLILTIRSNINNTVPAK